MSNYQHIARRVFNRAHLVEPNYASVLIGALTDRLNVHSLVMPDGTQMGQGELRAAAQSFGGRDRRIFEEVEGIAVIPVTGTLVHRFGHLDPYSGMTGYDGIQMKLEAALEDPSVRGILLDIDSPGGEVSGCFDLADFIYEARGIKPIWSLADELACSAAFALASATSRIITPRTAQVGSVGVLTAHVDHSRMLDAEGIAVTMIFAGDHKVDGNPYQPLPEPVRADIQAEIDELYRMFVATVARNRGISEQAVRDTEARVFTGQAAAAVKFTDEVMPARDVLGAFDEYLREPRESTFMKTNEVSRMAILGFGKDRKSDAKKAEKAARLEELRQEQAALEAELGGEAEEEPSEPETPEPESEPERQPPEGPAGDEPQPEPPAAASAQQVVALCAQAKVPQLAHSLIEKGVSLESVRAELANAGQIRDAFAAAGFPHLAAKAIETGMNGEFARTLLTELTAAVAGEEVSHQQPAGEQIPRASINAVKYYQQKQR